MDMIVVGQLVKKKSADGMTGSLSDRSSQNEYTGKGKEGKNSKYLIPGGRAWSDKKPGG